MNAYASFVPALLVASSFSAPLLAQCPTLQELAPGPHWEENFAQKVRVAGDFAVASGRGLGGQMRAALYSRGAEGWEYSQTLAAQGSNGGWFGGMDFDGTTLAMGRGAGPMNYGKVFLRERVGGVWQPTQRLIPVGAQFDDDLGTDVAVDGDWLAVSAPWSDQGPENSGAVFIYSRVAGGWSQHTTLAAPVPILGGRFGRDLELDGDTLAVREESGSTGKVYIYRLVGGTWTLEQEIVNPPDAPIELGFVLQGDTMVSPWSDGVVVYDRSGTTWTPTSVAFDDGYVGVEAVAIDGDRIVAGIRGEHVQVLEYISGAWHPTQTLLPLAGSPEDSDFGEALALEGDDLFVGSPGDTFLQFDDLGAVIHYRLDALAVPYCGPAVPNSTGLPAVLRPAGCGTLFANDLTLTASQLPPNQTALFLVSPSSGFVPMFGGGQGNLCLGVPLARAHAALTGAAGTAHFSVDLTALPTSSGFTMALPGQTWRFQCWYRDVNPVPTTNFTEAIQLLVQ